MESDFIDSFSYDIHGIAGEISCGQCFRFIECEDGNRKLSGREGDVRLNRKLTSQYQINVIKLKIRYD